MTAPLPGRAAPRLNIGDALHDGWQAFCRNPGGFVMFAVLLWSLQIGCQLLLWRFFENGAVSARPWNWFLAIVGLLGCSTSYFWGRIGIVRAASKSLQGQRPSFIEMIRWDRGPITRLGSATLLLLGLLVAPGVLIGCAVALPLFQLALLDQARAIGVAAVPDYVYRLLLVLLVLLIGLWLVAALYLLINQHFQGQICLGERLGPWATLRRSRALADPHWPLLLLLVGIEALLCLVGFLACGLGFLVAWPVVLCISTAAYRQLLALEAATPSLNPEGASG